MTLIEVRPSTNYTRIFFSLETIPVPESKFLKKGVA